MRVHPVPPEPKRSGINRGGTPQCKSSAAHARLTVPAKTKEALMEANKISVLRPRAKGCKRRMYF